MQISNKGVYSDEFCMIMRKSLNIFSILSIALACYFGAAGNLNAQSDGPNLSPREILQQAGIYLRFSQNLEIEAEIEFDVLLSPTLPAQLPPRALSRGKLPVGWSTGP